MRHLLIISIWCYRIFIRPFYRRTCLFRTSCSEEVLRETAKNGFSAGMSTLKFRQHYCRPGYHWDVHPEQGTPRIVFTDGKYLEVYEISTEMLALRR